jgi:hypothetical protein
MATEMRLFIPNTWIPRKHQQQEKIDPNAIYTSIPNTVRKGSHQSASRTGSPETARSFHQPHLSSNQSTVIFVMKAKIPSSSRIQSGQRVSLFRAHHAIPYR